MRTLGVGGVPMEAPLCLPCSSSYSYSASAPSLRAPSFTSSSFPSKFGAWRVNHRSDVVVSRKAAAAAVVRCSQRRPVAPPVRLESPTGQLLSEILRSHPYLLSATIDQQLERLQMDRDAQQEEEEDSKPPQDLLYKRIAEVRDKERKKAIEDIIYCLIIQKFMDREISMIPKLIPSSSPDIITEINTVPDHEIKLESVHSSDAFEMIQSHISIILGERSVGTLSNIIQMSKLKIGKLYAASIMYGYFLKRVDERYQLERSMNTLPNVRKIHNLFEDNIKPNPFWDLESMVRITPDDENDEFGGDGDGDEKEYRLRSYVMYLDAETLQRYATMRSKEAVTLIEKQTQALFGRPDIVVADDGSLGAVNDEFLTVTFQGLTMLVLEATAFGSFLWEAEGYVESKYHFVNG